MTRRTPSALFGIFLLLCQIVQGGMAAAMPCAGDFSDFVVCGAADTYTDPAPTNCTFCDSGACRMAHSPALSIRLAPIPGALPQSVAAPPLRVGRFTAPFEEILRPPK